MIIYNIQVATSKGTKGEDVYGKVETALTENEAALSANVTMDDVSMARIIYGNSSKTITCTL